MRPYDFTVANTVAEALGRAGEGTSYLAGGTTLVDLMKLEVMTPGRVVDVNRLPMRGVRQDDEGLHVGALERTPHLEHDLRPGELVTGVTVPRLGWARRRPGVIGHADQPRSSPARSGAR